MGVKGRARGVGSLAIGLSLLVGIAALVNAISARHYHRGDWTPGAVFSLSGQTVAVLRALTRPVRFTVFMVPPDRYTESVYHEVRELLRRLRSHTARLSVELIDIDADPARAEALARQFAVDERDLRQGVVVVSSGARSKYVPARAMADVRAGRLVAFSGEGELLSAMLSVTEDDPVVVCFSTGHGEAPTDGYDDAGYGRIVDEVRRDNYRVQVVDPRQLEAGLDACRVLVIGGPRRTFAAPEVDALERYVKRGGRVLLLLGPLLDRRLSGYRSIGLERWLARWGIALPKNVVVDRLALPGEQPLLAWGTRDGYGDHAIVRPLSGKLTIWRLAREVRAATSPSRVREGLRVTPLVRTSAAGWAEHELDSLKGEQPLRFDAAVDARGPVAVAAAVRWRAARLVVIGSERGLLNRRLDGRDHSRELFLGAIGWLAGQDGKVALGPKRPEHVRS